MRFPRILPSLPFKRCFIDFKGLPPFWVAWEDRIKRKANPCCLHQQKKVPSEVQVCNYLPMLLHGTVATSRRLPRHEQLRHLLRYWRSNSFRCITDINNIHVLLSQLDICFDYIGEFMRQVILISCGSKRDDGRSNSKWRYRKNSADHPVGASKPWIHTWTDIDMHVSVQLNRK